MRITDMPKVKQGLAILIAEDSAPQAAILKRSLVNAGYSVTVARNGVEGLAKLREPLPDMVISDITMPEMNGFEFCGSIKKDEKLKEIPVILLTSLSDPQDVIRGLECGADNFITKPYDENNLLSRIKYMLLSRELSKSNKLQVGLEIYFSGNKYFITSERQQILNLLLSTYEAAVQKNTELMRTKALLKQLNDKLEQKVEERTRQLLNAQEELVRKEKLSILGQLAGSVGHELRNPLGVINNAVYFLQTVLSDADETTRDYLAIIKTEIVGAERIVSDLLDAVRTKPPHPQLVSTEEVIRMSLGKCRLPESITVNIQAETQQRVSIDPHQMSQVFINLINNAAEAMSNKGRINISIGENRETKTVVIMFEDEGAGIAPENRAKIFQPLFTTKSRGIGLGLVMAKNMTEANGGRIEVKSEFGKGTTFTVILPCERA